MPDDPLSLHHAGPPEAPEQAPAGPASASRGEIAVPSPQGAADPASQAEDPYEGAVPPGYDWPTHGGYLGCLMGTLGGFMLGGFLDANLFSFLWASGRLAGPLFVLVALAVVIACIWALGRLGWWLGRRFYRAYQQPARPVWGEEDEQPALGLAGDGSAVRHEGPEA